MKKRTRENDKEMVILMNKNPPETAETKPNDYFDEKGRRRPPRPVGNHHVDKKKPPGAAANMPKRPC